MTNLFLSILSVALSASWLITAVAGLRLIIKRRAPKWVACLLWGIVALRLVLPFSIESSLSLVPSSAGSAGSEVTQTLSQNTPKELFSNADSGHALTDDTPAPTVKEDIPYVDAELPKPAEDIAENPIYEIPNMGTTAENAPKTPKEPLTVADISAIIWLGGVALMLIYGLVNYLILKRKMADSVIYADGIRQSDRVGSPFVLGMIRPTIYIPFGMDSGTESYVILHERAHINRRDNWTKPIGFLILAVYWFQPLVWLAYVLLCRDIEYACDEKVCRDMSKAERKSYTLALLECGVRNHRITACPVAFGEVGLKGRVRRALSFKRPAVRVVALSLAGVIAVSICFATVPKGKASEIEGEESSVADESPLEPDTSMPDTASYPDESTVTFSIGDNAYTAKAIFEDGGETALRRVKQITVFGAEGNIIQTIDAPENEPFGSRAIYAIDVSFDGAPDLLIPAYKSANSEYYHAFVWNGEKGGFMPAPGFSELSNFALDNTAKRVLSHRTASQITSYSISRYEDNDFVLESYLYYHPADEDEDIYYFREGRYENGVDTIVFETTLPSEEVNRSDMKDTALAQYFADGSKWELSSNKWFSAISDGNTYEAMEGNSADDSKTPSNPTPVVKIDNGVDNTAPTPEPAPDNPTPEQDETSTAVQPLPAVEEKPEPSTDNQPELWASTPNGLGFVLNGEKSGYYLYSIYEVAGDIFIPDTVGGLPVVGFDSNVTANPRVTRISIPASVVDIKKGTLRGLNNATITVRDGNPVYASAGNCIIDKSSKTLIFGGRKSVIPDDGSVEIIGEWAFENCRELGYVTIPASVRKISAGAFYGADIQSVTIPKSVKELGEQAFYNCNSLKTIVISGDDIAIQKQAFANCAELETAELSGVASVGTKAFDECRKLKSLVIGDGLESIGERAFESCSSLQSIAFPKSVTRINCDAFYMCGSLKSAVFAGSDGWLIQTSSDESRTINVNFQYPDISARYLTTSYSGVFVRNA